jgi:hypothetical protein
MSFRKKTIETNATSQNAAQHRLPCADAGDRSQRAKASLDKAVQ